MKKKALVSSVAAVVVVIAAVLLFRPQSASSPSPEDLSTGKDALTPFMFLAADDSGAVIASSDSTRGIASSGRTVWTGPSSRTNAVCVDSCPNAILTGDIDAWNSPVVKTPTPLLRGQPAVPLADGFQLWAPVRLGGAVLVLRTSKDGTTKATWATATGESAPIRIPGRAPTWGGTQDGPGVITTTEGSTTWATVATQVNGKPSLGHPFKIAGEGGNCVGPNGTSLVPIGEQARLVDQQGRTLPLDLGVTANDLGACTISRTGFITASLSASLGATTSYTSVLRFFSSKGALLRTVKEPTESIPTASRDGSTASFRTPQGIAVSTANGRIRTTYKGAIASRFTASGALVLLYPDGHVEWRKNP